MHTTQNNACRCPIMVGEKLPAITLSAFYQNDIQEIDLASYQGKWLVLFFYPADFTFVCPTELEELAEFYPQFKDAGAEVMSVSTDTPWVHKAWHDTSPAIKKITFPMLADPRGILTRACGVYGEESGLALRGSFVIDPQGILQAMEVHADGVGRSAKELLRKFLAAKFVHEHGDLVCPAAWEPGKDTLKPGIDLVGKI